MAEVSMQVLQPQAVFTVHQIPQKEQSEVVVNTTGIFSRVKESLIYWWDTFLCGARLAFANTGFLFFRALEFISPNLALRAEGIVLRISNAWQGMQHNRAIGNLLEEHAELAWQVRDLSRRSEDREALANQCRDLRDQNRYLQGLQQGSQGINQQQAGQLQAAVEQRNLLFNQKETLEVQVEALQRELQQSKDQLDPLNNLVLQLREKVAVAESLEDDFNKRFQQTQQALLEKVREIAGTCKPAQIFQQTELDDNLESLLPLHLNQIDQAIGLLDQVKQDLPRDGSAMIAIGSFERILGQLHSNLSNIPIVFRRHSAWQTHFNEIIRHLPMEVY